MNANYAKKLTSVLVAMVVLSGCSCNRIKSTHKSNGGGNSILIEPSFKDLSTDNKKISSTKTVQKTLTKSPSNIYALNSNKSLEVTISKYGYTRLYIDNERITDVFIYPQENIQVKIHQQGYLLLVPKDSVNDENAEENEVETIYATITGEQGTTQDFFLRFTGKNPDPVKFIANNLESINSNKGD
ncbi:MAG: hypothetical protein P8P83_04860 [Rickettsiaceae bacterium]|nr:hypothetical protein [Rickettsiaceae bacterium]